MAYLDMLSDALNVVENADKRGLQTSEAKLSLGAWAICLSSPIGWNLKIIAIVIVTVGYSISRGIAALGRAASMGTTSRALAQRVPSLMDDAETRMFRRPR